MLSHILHDIFPRDTHLNKTSLTFTVCGFLSLSVYPTSSSADGEQNTFYNPLSLALALRSPCSINNGLITHANLITISTFQNYNEMYTYMYIWVICTPSALIVYLHVYLGYM